MLITAFLDALGEKPVKAFEDMKLYYAPHRDDTEPMLAVDTKANRWYDLSLIHISEPTRPY